MANISSAFGTIRIETDTPKTLDIILKMFKSLEMGEYTTELEPDPGKISPTIYDGNFGATGRWCYLENIERFVAWGECCLSDEDKELLHNSKFEITYDYTDYEAGCLYLVSGDVLHVYDHGQEQVISDDLQTYNYTWSNLIALGVFSDLDDYIESETWYVAEEPEDDGKYFIEETNENLDDILRYYHLTSIEELMDRFPHFKETYEICKKYVEGC